MSTGISHLCLDRLPAAKDVKRVVKNVTNKDLSAVDARPLVRSAIMRCSCNGEAGLFRGRDLELAWGMACRKLVGILLPFLLDVYRGCVADRG